MGGLNLEYLGASQDEGTPKARCPKSSKSEFLCSDASLQTTSVVPKNMPVSRRPSWTENRAKAYASLPSSPVEPSTPVEETQPPTPPVVEVPFSLWDYLREEILATDFDSHQEMKWERVSNFLQVPYAVEKVRSLLLVCIPLTRADSILWVTVVFGLVSVYIHHHASAGCPFALPFDHEHGATEVTIYPAHAPLLLTIYSLRSGHMAPAAKADILRMILLASAIGILLPITDASKIYHTIRGQDTIKLYVIFNSLEVCSHVFSLACLFTDPPDSRPPMHRYWSRYSRLPVLSLDSRLAFTPIRFQFRIRTSSLVYDSCYYLHW